MDRPTASSDSPFEPRYGFSRAMRVDNRVIVAGTAPIPQDGEAPAASAHDQMLRCGEIALTAMAELGASAADVVRTRMFIVDAAHADQIGEAHAEIFGAASPPATMVVVAGLLDPGWLVEIEVEAIVR